MIVYIKKKKIDKDMMWHHDLHVKHNILRHPTDLDAWKQFNQQFPIFFSDP